jgi:glycosyltransferase involved in cell wall biosynthesis
VSIHPKVSVVIASYNQRDYIQEAVMSCLMQDYPNFEVIIFDDGSTDGTEHLFPSNNDVVKFYRCSINMGVGTAFQRGFSRASGDIIVMLCSDDVFTCNQVLSNIVYQFKEGYRVGHVSRYYHQFVGRNRQPVRAWRTNKPIIQANNPSGLAFLSKALKGKIFSNEMFIEASDMVSQVIKTWDYTIIPYDTVAVRIHESTSQLKSTYDKYWTKSPLKNWVRIGGTEMLSDFTSLIQIKNRYRISAVWYEIWMFIKLRPINLVHPGLWIFGIIALVTPRLILRELPKFYRNQIGRRITREVRR